MELKLVGAKTYVGPRSDNVVMHMGEVRDFKEADAEALLKEFQVDALNNEKPLFVEASSPAAVVKKATRRTRSDSSASA